MSNITYNIGITSTVSNHSLWPTIEPASSISNQRAMKMAMLELDHFFNGVLLNIDIKNPLFGSYRQYPHAHANIYQLSVTAKQFLTNYLLLPSCRYYKIKVNIANLPKEYAQFIVENLPDKAQVSYEVLADETVEGHAMGSNLSEQLIFFFKLLINAYDNLAKVLQVGSKPIVKIDGLIDLYKQGSSHNSQWLSTVDEINRNIVKDIFTRQVGLVDGSVQIDILSPRASSSLEGIKDIMTGIAMTLKESQAELFGESIQGFNSAGKFEAEKSNKLDEMMLFNVLIPFCQRMGIDYLPRSSLNLERINSFLDIKSKIIENAINPELAEEQIMSIDREINRLLGL